MAIRGVVGDRARAFVEVIVRDEAFLVARETSEHRLGDLLGRAGQVPDAHLVEDAIEVGHGVDRSPHFDHRLRGGERLDEGSRSLFDAVDVSAQRRSVV